MPGERRTVVVIAITATMMVVEIAAGVAFGSMALLADGLHMASHAVALAIAAFAYVYARRHAHDPRFSFGTGKVNSLGGFTGAVLLAVFAVMMAWESVERFIHPIPIRFDQAIMVALLGLAVNGVSAVILGREPGEHEHAPSGEEDHGHAHHHAHDHNLRSAYLHVLADALTSVLAIFALVAGKYFGLNWLDPAMGLVGALLVGNWSLGLVRTTSRVLLDHQAPRHVRSAVANAVQADDGNRVADLHVWAVGPGRYAAIVSVVTEAPIRPDRVKALLPASLGLCHVTVEINHPG
ncbi:MAG: cation transporter [Phycisphaerales bacterium]|nr:MAG: cation transporter [Phycisphaerales bacterium]